MGGLVVLLPPSESKRPGGDGRALDLGGLMLPSLRPERERVTTALVAVSADDGTGARMLRLGPSQRSDLAANRALRTSATMPAVDRYSGVLYDALGAPSLDRTARRWLAAHVLVHSAPFGPVGGMDLIPDYRLGGAAAALPGLPSLRQVWAAPVTAAIAATSASLVLDLRSAAYVALGPVAPGVPQARVRVVATGPDGARRALSHANKHAKGAFVRALARARPRIGGTRSLVSWADAAGWRLRVAGPGLLDLEA